MIHPALAATRSGSCPPKVVSTFRLQVARTPLHRLSFYWRIKKNMQPVVTFPPEVIAWLLILVVAQLGWINIGKSKPGQNFLGALLPTLEDRWILQRRRLALFIDLLCRYFPTAFWVFFHVKIWYFFLMGETPRGEGRYSLNTRHHPTSDWGCVMIILWQTREFCFGNNAAE